MKSLTLLSGLVLMCLSTISFAELNILSSSELDALVAKAVSVAQAQFPTLKAEEVATAVVDLRRMDAPKGGSFNGNLAFYPASVVKLFYLAATHQFIEEGRFAMTTTLQQGLSDMIVNSDNEATQYIVDAITGAPNGLDLPPREWEQWQEKRQTVNKWYKAMGKYHGINVCQKTYNSGPYGLDRLWLQNGANRNVLNVLATAQLTADIATRQIVTPNRCQQMLALMSRNMSAPLPPGQEDQAHSFTALALDPKQDKLWSKAGWTSTTRHDTAYIERPNGVKIVITTFTLNHALTKEIIPTIAKYILSNLPPASINTTGRNWTEPIAR